MNGATGRRGDGETGRQRLQDPALIPPRDVERMTALLDALRVEMRALAAFDCAGAEPMVELRFERWTT